MSASVSEEITSVFVICVFFFFPEHPPQKKKKKTHNKVLHFPFSPHSFPMYIPTWPCLPAPEKL